ncbi:MAG TPA: glycosyltransferase family 4 protein, partial [Longimicrobiales bacterium]|nr:glycosyltransferase family 4 protein [Longimicrobiales bacterium]
MRNTNSLDHPASSSTPGARPLLRRPAVCIFQRFLPPDPSGAGKQALSSARVIREAGWDVQFLTDAQADAPDLLDGFHVHRVRPPVLDPSMAQIAAYWMRVALALVRLRSRFDVLQLHTADFHHAGAIPTARLLGKPVLVRSSMAGEFGQLDGYRSGRLQKRILGLADAFSVLSERVANEYRQSGLPAEKLNIIPNGVDTAIYHPVDEAQKKSLRAELKLPENRRILIYHGVFIERKSLIWLLETLEPVLSDLDLHLVLVGRPARDEDETGYAGRLRERIARSPAASRITVRGYNPEVHRYLQAADVYLLASTNEGLPNALLEAMASGLAPIASRTSGSEDVIVDGRSGLLFEVRDRSGLLASIQKLLG